MWRCSNSTAVSCQDFCSSCQVVKCGWTGKGWAPACALRSMPTAPPAWLILSSRLSTAMSHPFRAGPAPPGGTCAWERDATSRFPSGRVAGRRRGCQLANRGDGPGPQRRGGTDTEPLGVAGREPAGVPETPAARHPGDGGPVSGVGTLKLVVGAHQPQVPDELAWCL